MHATQSHQCAHVTPDGKRRCAAVRPPAVLRKTLLAAAIGAVISGSANAMPVEDLLAPGFGSLTRSPDTVDISDANQQVEFTLTASDDLSGFAYGSVQLRSPNGQQYASASFGSYNRIAGDALDGTYRGSATLRRYAQTGNWTVTNLYLSDTVGNRQSYYGASLDALNLDVNLTVTGTEDLTGPSFSSLDFTGPTTFDITDANQRVGMSLQAGDNLAGLASGSTCTL